MKLEYIFYSLYSLIAIEMIIGLILRRHLLPISCLILVLFAVSMRILRLMEFKTRKKKSMNWTDVRTLLYETLVEQKILINGKKAIKGGAGGKIVDSIQHVEDNYFKENKAFISELRDIGIDGILCLFFLMQQEPALTAVKIIHKILQIPVASTYRIMQKNLEKELVTLHHLTNKPGKAYYRITDEGTSLIIQLYELLGGEIILPFSNSKAQQGVNATI